MTNTTSRCRRPFCTGMRGQSAVETMFMIPVLLLVFIGMYELFTITFGAQNAHIRAREYVLHAGAYTPSDVQAALSEPYAPYGVSGSVFDKGTMNYRIAEKDIWGLAAGPGASQGWRASAHDRGVPGVVMDSSDEGTYVRASAYLCSPIKCPPSGQLNGR